MIFVNYGAGGYNFIDHAVWNGLNIGDLVFPWFMWIMGVCIPISIMSSFKKEIPKKKSILLVLRVNIISPLPYRTCNNSILEILQIVCYRFIPRCVPLSGQIKDFRCTAAIRNMLFCCGHSLFAANEQRITYYQSIKQLNTSQTKQNYNLFFRQSSRTS